MLVSGNLDEVVINILMLIVVSTIFTGMGGLILFFSDKSLKYRRVSIGALVMVIIWEFPHLLLPDPTKLIDVFTHLASGLAVFMTASNLKWIEEKQRVMVSFFLTVVVIVGVELFLSIVELTTGYPNPIGFNIVEDIVWHVLGGVVGIGIYKILNNQGATREKRQRIYYRPKGMGKVLKEALH